MSNEIKDALREADLILHTCRQQSYASYEEAMQPLCRVASEHQSDPHHMAVTEKEPTWLEAHHQGQPAPTPRAPPRTATARRSARAEAAPSRSRSAWPS